MKHKPNHAARVNAPKKLCGGKRIYINRREAEAVRQEQELLTPGLILTIYRCTLGRHWHLTQSQLHEDEPRY